MPVIGSELIGTVPILKRCGFKCNKKICRFLWKPKPASGFRWCGGYGSGSGRGLDSVEFRCSRLHGPSRRNTVKRSGAAKVNELFSSNRENGSTLHGTARAKATPEPHAGVAEKCRMCGSDAAAGEKTHIAADQSWPVWAKVGKSLARNLLAQAGLEAIRLMRSTPARPQSRK